MHVRRSVCYFLSIHLARFEMLAIPGIVVLYLICYCLYLVIVSVNVNNRFYLNELILLVSFRVCRGSNRQMVLFETPAALFKVLDEGKPGCTLLMERASELQFCWKLACCCCNTITGCL